MDGDSVAGGRAAPVYREGIQIPDPGVNHLRRVYRFKLRSGWSSSHVIPPYALALDELELMELEELLEELEELLEELLELLDLLDELIELLELLELNFDSEELEDEELEDEELELELERLEDEEEDEELDEDTLFTISVTPHVTR